MIIVDLSQDRIYAVYRYFAEVIVNFSVYAIGQHSNYGFQPAVDNREHHGNRSLSIKYVQQAADDIYYILLADSQFFSVLHSVFWGDIYIEQLEQNPAIEPDECPLHSEKCTSLVHQHNVRISGALYSMIANPHWLCLFVFLKNIDKTQDFDWNGSFLLVALLVCMRFKLHCDNFILCIIGALCQSGLLLYVYGKLIAEMSLLRSAEYYLATTIKKGH